MGSATESLPRPATSADRNAAIFANRSTWQEALLLAVPGNREPVATFYTLHWGTVKSPPEVRRFDRISSAECALTSIVIPENVQVLEYGDMIYFLGGKVYHPQEAREKLGHILTLPNHDHFLVYRVRGYDNEFIVLRSGEGMGHIDLVASNRLDMTSATRPPDLFMDEPDY